jgi:acyl carrier protein
LSAVQGVAQEGEIARTKLRSWIVKHAKTAPGAGFDDDTRILEEGILSSLDIVEFVLYIESLRGEDIDVDDIDPQVFTSINTLYAAFFCAAA